MSSCTEIFETNLYPGLVICAAEWVKPGMAFTQRGNLYVNYDDVYKICFLNNVVSEKSVEAACSFAMQRINNNIDRLCQKAMVQTSKEQ